MENRVVTEDEGMGTREFIASAVLILSIFALVGGWKILPDVGSLYIGVGLIVGSVVTGLASLITLGYYVATAPVTRRPIEVENPDND